MRNLDVTLYIYSNDVSIIIGSEHHTAISYPDAMDVLSRRIAHETITLDSGGVIHKGIIDVRLSVLDYSYRRASTASEPPTTTDTHTVPTNNCECADCLAYLDI